jgi:hypothetical protein
VVDDLGRLGRVWREADFETTDFETVVMDLLEGQYKDPSGVFAFNPAEGWSRDVSEDVAKELRRRCDLQLHDLPSSIQDFVKRHEKARLLRSIADEADRGVLVTAEWMTPRRYTLEPKLQSAE